MTSTELRRDLRAIVEAAVAAVDPERVLRESVRVADGALTVRGERVAELDGVERVWLVGAGKGSVRMAAAALDLLGARVAGGCIAAPPGLAPCLPALPLWEAGHPVPNAHSLAAAGEALRLVHGLGPRDLVLVLLSGGASALWAAPVDGVSLGDLQVVTRGLLRAGAPIAELNTVRRHLSRIAGGQLARAAAPARVLTLAISDVVGVSPDVIGSGPTLPDPTTHAEALEILVRRGVAAPAAVTHHLQRGVAGEAPETPKPGELANLAGFHLLASIREALAAAAEEAVRLGYHARVVSDSLEGEAARVGEEIARQATGLPPRTALLWGGETTVTVRGDGSGGRNQELALAAALALDGHHGVALASVGTDGIDGPTPAAGAIVDGDSAARARAAGLDPEGALARNDSHPLHRATGDLLVTGPTGTNVNDVVVVVTG